MVEARSFPIFHLLPFTSARNYTTPCDLLPFELALKKVAAALGSDHGVALHPDPHIAQNNRVYHLERRLSLRSMPVERFFTGRYSARATMTDLPAAIAVASRKADLKWIGEEPVKFM